MIFVVYWLYVLFFDYKLIFIFNVVMKGIKVVKSFIFFVVENYKYIDNIYKDK